MAIDFRQVLATLVWEEHSDPAPTADPQTLTLRLRIAQKPCIVWSLGPNALYFEFLEPYGKAKVRAYSLLLTLFPKGPRTQIIGF